MHVLPLVPRVMVRDDSSMLLIRPLETRRVGLRLACITSFVLLHAALFLAPRTATGQQRTGWVNATSDSLVTRAIARRSMQLADSTLLSFEANAHGFLAFLAQLGDGSIIQPRVVQSEELVSRLYWWQPGRTVQRLVGRRDTTILPARVGYYRDRYQVVMDNLPDLIRLGDGQDVRDVPHPLSQLASSNYEFARGGQVRIRIPGREILVDEVRFRPRDDMKPGAVGSVYLDRETAAVVRLSMAFTRAAIIDRRIETLILTLENALVSGRYWLPRRQEVEVVRRATWFEIPARGIVRARWEVSGYVVNERIPPEAIQLPGWSSAPADSLRAFPFEGRVIDVLPPDIQMASDEDVKAARAQVESAVRAAALARPSRNALTGRGISDFARFSRTEGFAAGFGAARRIDAYRVSARGRYGFADQQVKGQIAVGALRGLGGETRWQLFAEREYRDVTAPERAGVTNSLAAMLFGSDYTTQMETCAIGLMAGGGSSPWHLRLELEQDRPLAVVANAASGAFGPTLRVWKIEGVRAGLHRAGGRPPQADVALRAEWNGGVEIGAFRGHDTDSISVHPLTFRLAGTLTLDRRLADDRAVVATTRATLANGRDLPPQWFAFAGGPWSAPGYNSNAFGARALLSQRFEFRMPVPAPSIPLGRFGRSPAHVTLAPFVQALAVGGSIAIPVSNRMRDTSTPPLWQPRQPDGIYPSAGVGVLLFYDLVRADVSKGLRDGFWRFSIDIDRSFWGIL